MRTLIPVSQVTTLAIARDGTRVASLRRCCFFGGPGCTMSHGRPQELANHKALVECGEPGQCILLYEGVVKRTDLEVGV